MNDRYLMHYGVKGMKWGVRHDPERSFRQRYGAREDAKSYKYNRSGESGWKGAGRAIKSKARLSKGQKKVLKTAFIAANVAGAGAIAVAALRSPAGRKAIAKGVSSLKGSAMGAKVGKTLTSAAGKAKTAKGKALFEASRTIGSAKQSGRAVRNRVTNVASQRVDNAREAAGKAGSAARSAGSKAASTARSAGAKASSTARSAAANARFEADRTIGNAKGSVRTAGRRVSNVASQRVDNARAVAGNARATADKAGAAARSTANRVRTDAKYARTAASAARDTARTTATNARDTARTAASNARERARFEADRTIGNARQSGRAVRNRVANTASQRVDNARSAASNARERITNAPSSAAKNLENRLNGTKKRKKRR